MSDLTSLADDIGALAQRLTDEIFRVVREQLRDDNPETAKETERALSRARRSMLKAEQILRHHVNHDDSTGEED